MITKVSYNAAGVLAHIASDGAESWKIVEPKREDVLNRIVTAIDRWDLDSKRNINYRYVYLPCFLTFKFESNFLFKTLKGPLSQSCAF